MYRHYEVSLNGVCLIQRPWGFLNIERSYVRRPKVSLNGVWVQSYYFTISLPTVEKYTREKNTWHFTVSQ